MNVIITSIKPNSDRTLLNLIGSLDDQVFQYDFVIETHQLGHQMVYGIQPKDLSFSQMFRHHKQITTKIYTLLQKVAEGISPQFPIDLSLTAVRSL